MQVANYGTMSVAGLVAGAPGTSLGVRPAVLLFATVHAFTCVSILLSAFGRERALPITTSLAAGSLSGACG